MTTKTITIDTEAYRRLKHVRQNGETFSQTIKRVVHEPIDFKKWMASIEKDPLSDKAAEAVEAAVSGAAIVETESDRVAILDTTVLIDLGRRSMAPQHQRARTAIQSILAGGEALFTTRINEAEFRIGPEVSDDRQRELARVERILAGVVVLEFNAEAATRYAVIKAAMFKRGRPVGDCDALIASIALVHGQSVLTRNPRHFMQIPGLVVLSY